MGQPATPPASIRSVLAVFRAAAAPPPPTPPRHLRLTPVLAGTLVSLCLADLSLALLRMPWNGDWLGAALAAPIVVLTLVYAVPPTPGLHLPWNVRTFVHLAFSFALGPPAVLCMAIAESLGPAIRRRPLAARDVAFDLLRHFLADSAAWLCFTQMAGAHPTALTLALAGLAGSLGQAIAIAVPLLPIAYLASESPTARASLRDGLRSLPMALLFGITAAAATLLYRAQGAWGVITLILPALIIQASLVALSRSTQAVERARERERAAREREAIALARETEALRVAAGAAEEEREQIAADIHDGAVQDLAGLLFTTRALDARLAAGDPPTPDEWTRYLEHCRDVGSIATRELQSMVVELDPPLLAERGLSAALAQLLSGLDPAIVCHLDCAHDPSEPGQQRLIYRAVREAYRNILKHAKCKNVWVEVGANGDRLVASVRDDGRGFSPEERARRQAQGHNGLGLLERTAAAQGCQITLSSAPGVGTTLSLSLPLLSRERGEQTAPASAP